MEENCKNCNAEVTQNYCPNCGQSATLKRIDKHYISHEVQHLLHFEKGVFYTAKELLTRPGSSIKEFITENRNKHMKPVPFLILTSLLYIIIAHFFHADKIYNEKEKLLFGESSIGDIRHWIQTHYGYANIIMGIFIALCVKLLFRKYKYNLFEITILICFVMGQGMLFLTLETFFVGLLNEQIFLGILTIISFAYPTWAIGHFFDKSKVFSYVKAFFAYTLGYLFFEFSIIIVGLIVDLISKRI
ncbi:DUF3667 domain-containing protein [Flavobacterium laiguense]|uniref:DUF3667 domain-containing protein n=1 Tax=Flavobacterium laiguense TaxID=2169409 RepID=A0A2U1JRA1_9FLAO|nr:DUF3667 domain-containing protein [Flavobacterium laiguense]PWA07681.1 hypothetical protein DB891_14375 [Flavobacterium laiguense]